MIVVSDTSALSNLAIVDRLWLLEAIYQTVIIPMDALIDRVGFRVSSQLYQRILALARELSKIKITFN
jgi:predicted nucleic acid-binding protein